MPEQIVRGNSGSTYQINKSLGNQARKQVYLAVNQTTGEECLLVRMHHSNLGIVSDQCKLAIGCPNTWQMFDTCDLPEFSDKGIICSYRSGEHISNYWRLKTTEQVRDLLKILTQLLETLSWMETKGLVHRNIHPENILVDEDGNVTLLDMETLAKDGSGSGKYRPGFHSPRSIASESAKHADDVFALLAVFQPIILSDFWMRYYRGHLTEQRPIEVYYQDGCSGKLKENVQDAVENSLSFLTENQKEVICSIFTDSFGNASASALLEKIQQF
jgi:serine/threonine protein kinase